MANRHLNQESILGKMKIDNFMAWFFSKHTQHIKVEIVGLTIFSTITWAYKLWIIMDFPKDYFT